MVPLTCRNVAEDPVLEAWITFNRSTGRYGFSFRYEGLPPHYQMEAFRSARDAVAWADPWDERIWEKPGEDDDGFVLVSRRFRPMPERSKSTVG